MVLEVPKLAYKEGWNIPKPTMTEKNVADQAGRVHIVTGGYAGVGLELVKLLYQASATIYIAGRSADKANNSIAKVKGLFPNSKGRMVFLNVDLSDFKTIKPAVQEFMSKESRLDVLTNNAGVMMPPKDSKDAQGHELQMGTNCLGHFLFAKLLLPRLVETAKTAPAGSVRVTWASSGAVSLFAPKDGVMFKGNDKAPDQFYGSREAIYGASKAGDTYLATEFALRYGSHGIISVSFNPGNLKTDLQRHLTKFQVALTKPLLYEPKFGGYTELWCACSPDLTAEHNGAYVAPWGRILDPRSDVVNGMKRTSQGGSGVAEKFWEWCDEETKQYQ